MALICEDLADTGVVLVSQSDDRAILENRSAVAIASFVYYWTMHRAGRIVTASVSHGTQPHILLPFTLPAPFREEYVQRNTMFPGQRRTLEPKCNPPDAEPLKLTVDGVFFIDGAFAGPNRLGHWDRLVACREAHLDCAVQAREAQTPEQQAQFFDRVYKMSGLTGNEVRRSPFLPLAPHRPPWGRTPDATRTFERRSVARKILSMREHRGDAATIEAITAWQDAPGPELHKL